MKKGFTLSELLLSLIIVGVIAVLTVPVLISNIQKKAFATQLKNMSAIIEQLAQDEMLLHKTRNLADTDFGDPAKLLSEDHFAIIKTCDNASSLTDCWKTEATGNDKVTYKRLNNSSESINKGLTVILKNGVIVRYSKVSGSNRIGAFLIDLNGNEKPNISGRDLFGFFITDKGVIVDKNTVDNISTLSEKQSKCKTGVWHCYEAVRDDNWKMEY